MDSSEDYSIRLACLDWLNRLAEERNGEELLFSQSQLFRGFLLGEERITLGSPKGIHKPKGMRWPLSILSVSHDSKKRPYKDTFEGEDKLLYRYRGSDPRHPDNVGLREAMARQIPLVYFHGVGRGLYMAVWPVFIVEDRPSELTFVVMAGEGKNILPGLGAGGESVADDPEIRIQRKYATRQVLARIHQQTFRQRVLRAYRRQCAVCRLKHMELLEAAHIIPDPEERGEPIVRNGLSLCKIHHAAFDRNILGISPDYIIEVREDILEEENGPMLRHGFQEMHGERIILPRNPEWRPDRDRLAERYERFREAV